MRAAGARAGTDGELGECRCRWARWLEESMGWGTVGGTSPLGKSDGGVEARGPSQWLIARLDAKGINTRRCRAHEDAVMAARCNVVWQCGETCCDQRREIEEAEKSRGVILQLKQWTDKAGKKKEAAQAQGH
jgi:hypothetical protein